MEVGLSICHAEATQSKKMTFFIFPSTLFLLLPRICWLLLAADAHWADDLRQLLTATSGLFPVP